MQDFSPSSQRNEPKTNDSVSSGNSVTTAVLEVNSVEAKPLVSDTSELTLLGKASLPQCDTTSVALLETFASPNPERDFLVTFTATEYTSLCPVTGQPDFGTILIEYIPSQRCIESKSLKLYLGSFRNQASFGEVIVNRILDDVVAAIQPRKARVIGDFTPRGAIGIRVEATYDAIESSFNEVDHCQQKKKKEAL